MSSHLVCRLVSVVSLLGCLVPATAVAQGATYLTTRDACNGDPVTRCIAINDQSPSLSISSSPSDYAFAVVNPLPMPIQILGFELWTSSNTGSLETVPSRIYEDATGPGATVPTMPAATPIATGSISVNGYNTWWSTSVYPAPILQPNQAFWVGFFPGSRISPPINLNGSTFVAPVYRRQSNINNNAWLTFAANGFPAVRVRCTGFSAPVPMLTNLDLPRIGQQFRLSMGTTHPFSPAFVVWAFNSTNWVGLPTPWNLAGMGAPDCFVHTSTDFSMFLLTDALGQATQTVVLPPSPWLVGFTFYNQGALFSPLNALGFTTTNMGRGVIGQ
jgi:hypothetical protein